SPREAAIYATNEVWLAVIVTTLTVVAVFLPLTLVGGMTGVLFLQLGWVVTITVVTSTIAAISLTPMLSSQMLRLRPANRKKKWYSHSRTVLPFLNWIDNFYGKSVAWSLRHKLLITLVSVGIFVSSFFFLGNIGTEFIPESDSSSISASIELQTGTRFEESMKITHIMENFIANEIPEAELNAATTGSDDRGGVNTLFQSSGSNIINMTLSLVKPGERSRSVWDIAEILRAKLLTLPEVVNFTVSTESGMGGMGGGNAVELEVYGYDLDATTLYARDLQEKIEQINGAREVKISREKFKPELTIQFDREKLAEHGLSTAVVSNAVRNRVSGMISTRFRQFGDEYNVVVRYKEDARNSITDLENILIASPTGSMVRLNELGEVKQTLTPPNIERKRKQRVVTVSAVPYQISLGELATEIQAVVDEAGVPQGMSVQIGGSYEDMEESFMDLGLLALLSIVLVFIVMA
ncbi:MAG TPA: efflux RND transporter permease subunit, partial [Prolixibacteraceae bacterium]|nr:efflux RND transporter permease subunit [Prolixibacteraceae bacterium]